MKQILYVPLKNREITIEFLEKTKFGEPSAWLMLSDESSIEITQEEHRYYSIRHHCNESDFENDVYPKTLGVISECVANTKKELEFMLMTILKRLAKENIFVIQKKRP